MGFFLSLLFGIVPMLFFAWFIYWLDRYEKEPLMLLGGVFTWGAVVAAGGAFLINSFLGLGVYFLTGSEAATEITTGSLIAPIVEETLKGIAILMVFLIFRHEFDSILDGIVYGAIVALGFAATENIHYIYSYGYLEQGYQGLLYMIFVRVILVGWQHPFYTAFTGIGLAIARLNSTLWKKICFPIAGWCVAIFTHAMHNTITTILNGFGGLALSTLLDWSGWLLLFIFILWVIFQEHQLLVIRLREEVISGSITPAQYHTACSAWLQSYARFSALLSGHYSATHRFYQLCGELAHKKEQLYRYGEEGNIQNGNTSIILNLQSNLTRLSPLAKA